MIQEKQKISGTLNSKQSLNGTLSNSVIYVDPITQEKTVIPTAEQQIVTPDENYTGLSKVTVEAIQDENLISENIKNGVDILGVTGNYVGSKYAPRHISFYRYSGTELNEELSNLDTRGDVYPKEYYVSQYKVYNTRNSDLLKSMKKPEVVGTSNSTVEIYKRNMYGNYDSFKIVRNGSNIRRIDDWQKVKKAW